ncbi:MAG: purine-binding chemotaxis protein CheW [Bacteroidetes bacterium]|nr:purine-binding chemotaxis protein CheW [Bacteroidota bacterium]MBE3113275.1 purine-binding chemotaxis protein CheW [Actinomycetota bacterium]
MDGKDVAKKDPDVQTRRSPQVAPETGGKIIQLIVFNLGGEEFGVDIAQIREIIRTGPITPIPYSPDFIDGLINVRGEISVVIDLKKRFLLRIKKEIEEKHIIMTEQDKNLIGLKVDEVTEVLRIHEEEIKTAPELVDKIDTIYIRGVLILENRLIIILDLEKVLSEGELVKLSKIMKRHSEVVEKAEEKAEEKEAKAEEAGEKAEEKEEKVEEKEAKVKKVKVQNEKPGQS